MKKLLLATCFPEISKAINAGYRIKDIQGNLKSKNLEVTISYLAKTIKQIKAKKILPTTKLICFYPFNKVNDNYLDFAVAKDGLWYAQVSAISDIDKNWIITPQNILQLKSPLARVYSKWLLQEFELPNEYLINNDILTKEQLESINDIPNSIIKFIDEIRTITHKKYLEYIFLKLKPLN